jgi:hypothetical protein
MVAYHLEINDESMVDKVKAFFKTLPSSAVTLTEEKEDFFTELEEQLRCQIDAPSSATHQEVVSHLKAKYAFE